MHSRAVKFLLEVSYRVHRIIYFAPGMVRAGFRKRCDEARMIGAGNRHHGVTIRVRSHAPAMFMRWTSRGNEMNFVQMKPALGRARDCKVADVNGIECAAEERDPAFARISTRSSVGLRRRNAQLSSGGASPCLATAW